MQGRHLLENNITVNTYLDEVVTRRPRASLTAQLSLAPANASEIGTEQLRGAVQARRMLHLR